MQSTSAAYTGTILFWTIAGNTNRQLLLERLSDIGYGKLCPAENTPNEALKEALVTLFADKHTLIRPLNAGSGFAIVDESATAGGGLQHTTRFECRWIAGRLNVYGVTSIVSDDDRQRVYLEYNNAKACVPANKIGTMLSGIVSLLNGVALRPTGGFYWLPPHSLATITSIASCIEEAGKGNTVYRMSVELDEGGKRAAMDAIKLDIESLINESRSTIASAKQRRTYVNQAKSLKSMEERLAKYEEVFGPIFGNLHSAIEAVTVELVTISLENMGDLLAG